jgi:hypothetical protein
MGRRSRDRGSAPPIDIRQLLAKPKLDPNGKHDVRPYNIDADIL